MHDEVIKALLLLTGRIRVLGDPGSPLWNMHLEGGQKDGAYLLGNSDCRAAVVFFALGSAGLGARTCEDVHSVSLYALHTLEPHIGNAILIGRTYTTDAWDLEYNLCDLFELAPPSFGKLRLKEILADPPDEFDCDWSEMDVDSAELKRGTFNSTHLTDAELCSWDLGCAIGLVLNAPDLPALDSAIRDLSRHNTQATIAVLGHLYYARYPYSYEASVWQNIDLTSLVDELIADLCPEIRILENLDIDVECRHLPTVDQAFAQIMKKHGKCLRQLLD
jgi:hypothetical protein